MNKIWIRQKQITLKVLLGLTCGSLLIYATAFGAKSSFSDCVNRQIIYFLSGLVVIYEDSGRKERPEVVERWYGYTESDCLIEASEPPTKEERDKIKSFFMRNWQDVYGLAKEQP